MSRWRLRTLLIGFVALTLSVVLYRVIRQAGDVKANPTTESSSPTSTSSGEDAAMVTAAVANDKVNAEYLDCLRRLVCPLRLGGSTNTTTVYDDENQLRAWCRHTIGGELRIACVGDSITYGNGSHATAKSDKYASEGNYPLELQQMAIEWLAHRRHEVGESPSSQLRVVVRNFGRGGHTACDTPPSFSYRRCSEFRASKKFAPHLVIFMLGTNDSKPRSWASVEAFLEHLHFFNDAYRKLKTKPQMVIMAPPPSLSTLGRINGSIIEHFIRPAVLKLPAEEPTRWRLGVDLFTPFFDRVKDPSTGLTDPPTKWPRRRRSDPLRVPGPAGSEWLHDGVHPTLQGHQLIAQIVASTLCDVDVADRAE